jgi:hypothetical protein
MAQTRALSFSLLLLLCFSGCQSLAAPASSEPTVWSTVPASWRAPLSIERLAVLYPKTYDRELMEAYSRLEGMVFQLKERRPYLRIVDRFNLDTVLGEQRFQVGGLVSDEAAVRLGRLLGVDGVILYRIVGPSLRDRFVARYGFDLESGSGDFIITSKIIMIETAEVVFHNVVTSRVEPGSSPVFRIALDLGIMQTAGDLLHAFR